MRHPFIKQILAWMIPGIAAGIAAACLLTSVLYRHTESLAGSVLKHDSVAEALKEAKEDDVEEGRVYLERYGYRPYGRLQEFLWPSMTCSVLLFELAGLLVYTQKCREEKKRKERLSDLTGYLAAANHGEAPALMRKEDEFSHLEDEIYKTVMKLEGTKEEAVRDHEILSRRISDIAHQLKTPLTSMSLMTELMETYQTEETAVYLERLKNQAERLKVLVNDLLALAKIDAHTIRFQRRETELSELLEISMESLYTLCREKQIRVEISGEREATAEVDEKWTSEAVINVLKNCMEHTPEGGILTIRCNKNPLYTEMEIEDSGPGFERQDIPHLFERFYKGKGAAGDSAGIGLALAKMILEAQNGHILAENSSAGHARFVIRFYPDR